MGIIVRVAEGIVVSEELYASLQALFQQDIKLEPYSPKPNQQVHCLDRINSLQEAFLAIMKAIPTKHNTSSELLRYLAWCKRPLIPAESILADYHLTIPATILENINGYLDWCYQNKQHPSHLSLYEYQQKMPANNDRGISDFLDQCCVPPNLTVNDYQAILSDYTAKLIGAVHDYYLTDDEQKTDSVKKQSTHLLNKAEQYVIMQNGRDNLATVSLLPSPTGDKLIVQWEQQVIPYLPETLDELHRIKNSPLSVTPAWFRQLPSWRQVYFHSSKEYQKSWRDLHTDVNSLLAEWKKIKKTITPDDMQAINALNSEDLKQLAKADTLYLKTLAESLPDWFTALPYHYQADIKKLLSLTSVLDTIDDYLIQLKSNHFDKTEKEIDDLDALRKLPYWFLRLEEREQQLLTSVMNQRKALEDIFSFVPSRLRTLPLLANAALHYLAILSPDGSLLKQFPARMRSSHFASRDVKNEPREITDLYSHRNMTLIMREAANKPLLIQTLISPVWYMDNWIPDLFLDDERCKTVARFSKQGHSILSSNHAYNIANKIMWTAANDASCLEIIASVREQLSADAIAGHFKSLGAIHNGFLSQGAYQSVCFTMEERHYKQKLFARLMQLVDACSLIKHDYPYDEFQNMVHTAWLEVIDLKQANIAFSKRTHALDRKHTLVDSLIQVFSDNYHLLSQWENWLPVFSHHAFLASSEEFTDIAIETTKRYGELAQLLCEFQYNTLNSGLFSAVGNNCYGREIWLSSLETLLMIYRNGFSAGSCVSGKDRKAIELIHTDAMLLFRECYGYWPSINDVGDDRKNFVAIFDHLYTTWHQHIHSGQNACGSAGIKTPVNYLPGDIAEAICNSTHPDALYHDDMVATNNEVGRIGDAYARIKYNYARCLIASMRMSEQQRIALLDQLKIILGEESFWTAQTKCNYNLFYPSLPEGIQRFKRVFEQGGASLEILANIYYELNRRPKESAEKSASSTGNGMLSFLSLSLRSSATKSLYAVLQYFYEQELPDIFLNIGLGKLQALKEDIFRFNGESRSAPVSPCPSPPLACTSSAEFG